MAGRNGNGHKPRPVDYLNRQDDHECALLGAMGFSTRYIMSRCPDLSSGQVTYRLKKANIKRMDFRNGESVFARMMLRSMRDTIDPKLVAYLRKHVPADHL